VCSCNSNSNNKTTAKILPKNIKSNSEIPIDTKFAFPEFTVIIHSFKTPYNPKGYGRLEFNGDSSKVYINIDENNIRTLTAKSDTIGLQANIGGGYTKDLVELIPNNKTDIFKFSYSARYIIFDPKYENKSWSFMNTYKPLKDSLNRFFKIPESAQSNPSDDEIRKNLKSKDIKGPDDIAQIIENYRKNLYYRGLSLLF
jgi:hypothetical protein